MDKKTEINYFLDNLKEEIRKNKKFKSGRYHVRIPDQLCYFVDKIQECINKIFEEDDYIIRW